MTEPADVPKTGDLSQSEEPADSAPPSADTIAAETPAEEPAAPMDNAPHVHAPQGGIHNWRDFFVHIAVVAIGLLLAIGLEQSVEAAHHAHQREQLEEQMRETFEANSQTIAKHLPVLEGYRAYLLELRSAVAARRRGQSLPVAPSTTDPRIQTFLPPPQLGAYQAAKANGTVALLSLDRIRLYNRIEFQHSVLLGAHQQFRDVTAALREFRQRFVPSSSMASLRFDNGPVDLAQLSSAELEEYQALIGATIDAVDRVAFQFQLMDVQCQAVLNGARTEADLMEAIAIAQDVPAAARQE